MNLSDSTFSQGARSATRSAGSFLAHPPAWALAHSKPLPKTLSLTPLYVRLRATSATSEMASMTTYAAAITRMLSRLRRGFSGRILLSNRSPSFPDNHQRPLAATPSSKVVSTVESNVGVATIGAPLSVYGAQELRPVLELFQPCV